MELKPCPFCGSREVAADYVGGFNDESSVRCEACGIVVETGCDYEEWNHRPIEDAKAAEVAALLEKNEDLRREIELLENDLREAGDRE